MKNILKLFIIITPLLCMLFFMKICIKNQQKSAEFRGVLVEIYTDPENRNQWAYKIQTVNGIKKQSARVHPGSLDYIEIGDSIIKRKNELLITIKKKKYNYNRMARFHYYE